MSATEIPIATTVDGLLRALVLDVFDEHDPRKRTAAIEQIFTSDVYFASPTSGARHGWAGVNEVVEGLHDKFPDFRFHLTSEPQAIEGSGRVTWGFGPPGGPAKITGMDIIVLEDGKIRILLTFLDIPAAPVSEP